MTIDERIERLTERHEALSQSLELFIASTHAALINVANLISQDAENIRALARIAEAHETRIERLES